MRSDRDCFVRVRRHGLLRYRRGVCGQRTYLQSANESLAKLID